jgi:hypothetical protein
MLESPVNPLTRALASAALGLLILKRRLILKLFGARRVGYEFSKQLNLKRRAKKMRTLSGMRPPRLILAEESHGFALDCRHSNAGVQRRRLLGSRSLLVSKRSYWSSMARKAGKREILLVLPSRLPATSRKLLAIFPS